MVCFRKEGEKKICLWDEKGKEDENYLSRGNEEQH